jgi:H+-transporting ATPase
MALSAVVWWAAASVWRLDLAQTQTLLFVWLVFGSTQATLYAMRAQGFFWERPFPGRWLLLASAFDVGVASLLATQGWLMAPVSAAQVGGMLLLAALFLVAAGLLKVALPHFSAFNAHWETERRD